MEKLKGPMFVFVLLAGVLNMLGAQSRSAENLLYNGDFKSPVATKGEGADWPAAKEEKGISYPEEDGKTFLRLTQKDSGQYLMAMRVIKLKPEDKALKLTVINRHNTVKQGAESWNTVTVLTKFKDSEGRELDSSFKFPKLTGSSDKWTSTVLETRTPKDAATLEITPALLRIKEGSLDIAAITVEAIPEDSVPPPPLTSKQRDELAVIKENVPAPKELHVEGNRIVDPDGKEVWLQGLAIASLEWTATGHGVLYSAQVAIDDWKSNVVRIPVKERYWFGEDKYQKDGGKAYREYLDKIAKLVNSRGAYFVLDLHNFRAPKEKDLRFWKEAAERYKNNPGVLFDVFNEPHEVSWEVWRNGGLAEIKHGNKDALKENSEQISTEKVLGMQDLVDAIRATGAKNIVIVGGLDWAYDLSGILKGYALDDKGGNGIVYATHVYPWKSKWQESFIDAAEKYPIFVGEVGCQVERMPFIPPERHEDPYKWAPDMLHIIKKYRLNWAAWCFHPKASPCVILDWNYTPTPYWGVFVKEALAGKDDWPFKRLR